ncbi:MAG: type III PLP-dependent enzyme [Alphaproteobacteria bacterium]|nr:type III PLP-dependent enzyme [Alphaproteobacteria bacterium]
MNKVVPLAKEIVRRSKAGNQPARLMGNVNEVVAALRPSEPLYVLWPERVAATAKAFMDAFPGDAMFAVKTNPHESVIRALCHAGMKSFDAASLEEIRLVRRVSKKARIHFMHTVKAPEAIRAAYYDHGVRDFSLDTIDELNKILSATNYAEDINLFIRFAPPKNGAAAIDFSSKFGASPDEAALLLRSARSYARRLGLCFHVGTQISDASVYARTIGLAAAVIRKSGVPVDMLDTGGGFPVSYPGEDVPEVSTCIDAIKVALALHGLDQMEILAEPGRALVAQNGCLVVRVELRKGDLLYINDGTYGGLFDAGPLLKTRFPVRAIRPGGTFDGHMKPFRMAGPTCDSLDMMNGPFMLPADIAMGDWIEIGNLGAYSQSMRTNFNGFGSCETVCLADNQ